MDVKIFPHFLVFLLVAQSSGDVIRQSGKQICAMLGPSPAQKGKSNAILVELNSSFSAAHRKIQLTSIS